MLSSLVMVVVVASHTVAATWQLALPGLSTNDDTGSYNANTMEECGNLCGGYWITFNVLHNWCYCGPGDQVTAPTFHIGNPGEDVYYNSTPNCTIGSISGQWVELQSNPGPSSLSVTLGVQHGYAAGNTTTWGSDVTTQVKTGFSAFGASASVSVSGEMSDKMSSSYSQTFQMSSATMRTFDFDAGFVWQWQFKVTDRCGSSIVSGTDFAITAGEYAPPCCLPGWAKNISEYKDCVAPTNGTAVDLCASSRVVDVVV